MYRNTLRKAGVYIIGGATDQNFQVVGSGEIDPYLFINWPINFIPYYIGISETKRIGVRGRLSSHRRCKGSKEIARRVRSNERLYFICAYGDDLAKYESLFLCLKATGQFEDNVRNEIDRDSKRRYKKIRSEMTQFQRELYDSLDYDGRGL
ncbi:hypothetical protein I5T99_19330 [Stenotrophomonas maltophilia]|uniref:hypothetical protein n=1 Tax=Stenotrophomonas geniculata TaxID=86188 RepID=UPI000F822EB3|nr:hypothetical protein [Stenotrophomonas geniculata]MBH1531213.1 hypothetical protein [Stenotrophomonas maltophilia]MCI1112834.1 hypothetical protein [Stenotrophomonas maltophilia]RTY01828.1 hypothetical protein EKT70_20460 [Stenotrophomonas geniculata]